MGDRHIRAMGVRAVITGALLAATVVALVGPAAAGGRAGWSTAGQNPDNSRYQPNETTISAANVAALQQKWVVTTGGDVSATPAVDDNKVYVPDSAGNLYAINRATGAVVWTASIAAATGISNDYSRTTPAIAGNLLIVGTQSGKFETPLTNPTIAGAYVLAFDKNNGSLVWKTKVDNHFSAIVTQSATIFGNSAFVGVASNEEAYVNRTFNGGQPYECCTFRGSVLSLNVKTGAIAWKTYMVPDIPGYTGSAVWGSTPAVDPSKRSVYVATGNNYSLPPAVSQCVIDATSDSAKRACIAANDYFDSIVSMNMDTGAVQWAFNALSNDAWNVDCGIPGFELDTGNGNCPPGEGPDYDFGQGPMLFTIRHNGKARDLIGAGEKSGDFWALDRRTGQQVWNTQVGAGGLTGGLQWGSATDGTRIYVAESNSSTLSAGFWAALDPATGAVLWQTTDGSSGYPFGPFGPYGYSLQGPVSVANGVMYGCSLSPNGPNMFALDAGTGEVKWSFASGASCLGGASIVDGTVFWGTGYRSFAPLTTAGNKLFAFALPGS